MEILRTWLQDRDLKFLLFGFFLLICSVLSIVGLLRKGYESSYVSGIILFTLLGLAFIRKSKKV